MELNQFTPKCTVVAIISRITDNKEYILLTKRKVDPYKDRWCLPGGHINENETAIGAVIREVKEETGLDYKPKFLNYSDEIIPGEGIHAVTLIFKGTSSGTLSNKNSEVSDARWVSLEDTLNYDLAFQHDEILKLYMENNYVNENVILTELKYLRDEVLKRFETRNMMINFAIILTGAILTFGKVEVYILYPIIGTILAGLWSHSDIRIDEIGDYIKNRIEPKLPNLGWEAFLYKKYKPEVEKGKRQEKYVILVFYSTYLIMISLTCLILIPEIICSISKNGIGSYLTIMSIIKLAAGIIITIISLIFTRKYIKTRRDRFKSK
jgi:8-oxo-dGTP diphosphatase